MAGAKDLPLFSLISDYIFYAARQRPGQVAMALGDNRLTYAESALRIQALSRALIELGVRRGDRVAMLCTPRPEFFLTFLAAADIGAIWVGLNPRYRLDEMRFILADCQPRLLFALTGFQERDFTPDLAALMADYPDARLVTIEGKVCGSMSYDEFLDIGVGISDSARTATRKKTTGNDPTLIIYTSGTTGEPKGALLTHNGLVRSYCGQWNHVATDPMIDVCNLPINHIGCFDLCCMPLISGGTIHFMERFDVEGLLSLIEREHITFLGQVPTIFQLLAASSPFETTDLSSLLTVMWSGSAMGRDLIQIYRRRTRAQLMVTYGLTESICAITYSEIDADIDTLATTVGKPDPRLNVRLVAPDGHICGVGEEGEIQVWHDAMMVGYYNRSESTAEAFTEDGFLRTGDMAVMHQDGNLSLVGRLKEMYKSGGYNVYPREIEHCLERHESVAIAAVVSVPDPVYQEVGHAFVVPKPGRTPRESELISWCRKYLANYKVPKRITVTSHLPMLAVGKIDKQALNREARVS
jgi:acyl-CoA synthetase (AMP-forming)/AMP-acid ligase II